MFGLAACTWSLIVLALIAAVTLFGALIVLLGYGRLIRESGKMSAWTVATSFPLFRAQYFGAKLEIPRRRLAGIMTLVLLLLSILVLSAAARSVTC